MTRRTARAAQGKSFFREWWPELAYAAFFAFVGFCYLLAPAKDGQGVMVVFAIGVLSSFTGLGWWMGQRHRRLPVHRQIREIWETTHRIEDRGLDAGGPQPMSGPLARIIPMRRK